MSAILWEARFHDMGRSQVLGEVEAPDATTALREARQQFALKRIRPASRIFVKRLGEEAPPQVEEAGRYPKRTADSVCANANFGGHINEVAVLAPEAGEVIKTAIADGKELEL